MQKNYSIQMTLGVARILIVVESDNPFNALKKAGEHLQVIGNWRLDGISNVIITQVDQKETRPPGPG